MITMKKDWEGKEISYSPKAGISEDVRMRFIAVTRKGTVDKRAQEAAESRVSYAASMSSAEEIQPEGYYACDHALEALFGSRMFSSTHVAEIHGNGP